MRSLYGREGEGGGVGGGGQYQNVDGKISIRDNKEQQ